MHRLSLVLPGLLDLPAIERRLLLAAAPACPALELILSRATRDAIAATGLEATLFALFEVATASHLDLPVAAVSYQADRQIPAPGWCLRADPVHLVPDRDRLVLLGPEALHIDLAEAQALCAELNRVFAEDGWRLEAPHPDRWYLHLNTAPALRTYSLAQVRGQAIGEYLPAGVQGRQWQAHLNEIQMILHTHTVNVERQSSRRPTISSVWFWGGGETPTLTATPITRVWSDEATACGLGFLSGAELKVLPENAEAVLVESPSHDLLVLDQLSRAWQREGEPGWQTALQGLARDWFEPLLQALRDKRLTQLDIYTCEGRCFRLTPARLRRWWHRRRPLAGFS